MKNMAQTTEQLASRVPRPKVVPFKGSFNFRYAERTIHQALVQKLARLVSCLHATRLLMEAGFVQEQAALQRILDEIAEDISFLSWSVINNETTPLHEAYLSAFYLEEFDSDSEVTSSSDRPMIHRKKIRAYLDRAISGPKGSSRNLDAARTVSKAYSGYVHAASPQIMDMYSGNPPRFHMHGMRGTTRHLEHRADFWNYMYRGICAFCISAKAFGDEELFKDIRQFNDEFVRQTGNDLQSNEWPEI
ncbi:MAG: hypothetical protein IPP85_11180 [Propionivibrio sp.]|nr:hypothetical protein [Propionivibrio sp.]